MKLPRTQAIGLTLLISAATTVTALTALGRDDDRRFISLYGCENINIDIGKGEVAALECVAAGAVCVLCVTNAGFGDWVDDVGEGGKMFRPYSESCSGPRQESKCVASIANPGSFYCDPANYKPSGTCGGYVTHYEPQPIPAPPPPGQ